MKVVVDALEPRHIRKILQCSYNERRRRWCNNGRTEVLNGLGLETSVYYIIQKKKKCFIFLKKKNVSKLLMSKNTKM